VDRGLLWLAVVDLKRAWLRSALAALAIALALIAVTFFAAQVGLRQAELLSGYEESGAATFVVELGGKPTTDVAGLIQALRSAAGVQSVEAPYNGTQLGLVADTSFVVFENEKQQESLGARTTVLGVDRSFDPVRDYYVNFHDLNPNAPQAVLGAPLLATSGTVRPPERNEVVVPSGISDYVGIRSGAEATIDLMYVDVNPPIVRRFEGLRLIGTFELVGPDQGRFEPFWRLAARGREVLTVRRPDAQEGRQATGLPILLSDELVREFLGYVSQELDARGEAPVKPLAVNELVVRPNSVGAVPSVEAGVVSVLEQRGLKHGCSATSEAGFCLRLPERNNFQAALEEQKKLEGGGSFFISLLLVLMAVGTAGLQVQLVLARWREFGILQAIGFSPIQILLYSAIQLYAVLAVGTAAAAAVVILPFARAVSTFIFAAGIALVAASVTALPALLWPLAQRPAELLRVSA
jgi:hypothetical protein